MSVGVGEGFVVVGLGCLLAGLRSGGARGRRDQNV